MWSSESKSFCSCAAALLYLEVLASSISVLFPLSEHFWKASAIKVNLWEHFPLKLSSQGEASGKIEGQSGLCNHFT